MVTPIDALELSKDLIACPSVTPENAGALDVLQNALEPLGFTCQRMVFSAEGTPDVDNLYARYGTQSPNICFAGHTDVVPAGDVMSWSNDPFTPVVKDGMLYGRGASDMKCAIASFVAAVSEYLKSHKPKGSISLLITGDEEGPAVNGTKKMLAALQEQGEKIDACVVGEPTNPDILGRMIKIGRRGSVSFTLEVNGQQGHVAYPHLADNPVSRITKILHQLDENVLDEGNEYFEPSNLELLSIDVNNMVTNLIPGQAIARFNIRFNNQHTSKTLIKWVEGICDSLCETGEMSYVLNSRTGGGEAFLTKPGKLSELLSQAVKEVTGQDPELSTSGGTSDARFIKDYCPVVEFGMMNQTAHKVDECSPVDDIYRLKDVYRVFLEKFLPV